MLGENAKKTFSIRYNKTPLLVRAPGHIKYAGEFTDFFWGKSVGTNINREIFSAMSPNYTDVIRIYFIDDGNEYVIAYDREQPNNPDNYRSKFLEHLFLNEFLDLPGYQGFDCVIESNFNEFNGFGFIPTLGALLLKASDMFLEMGMSEENIAKRVQRAENQAFSLSNGVFAPLLAQFGKKDYSLFVDNQNLKTDESINLLRHYKLFSIEVPDDTADFLSFHQNIRKSLIQSLTKLNNGNSKHDSLRDITYNIIDQHKHQLTPEQYNHISFLIDENSRVDQVWKWIQEDNVKEIGAIFNQSMNGIKTKYMLPEGLIDKVMKDIACTNYCAGIKISTDTHGASILALVPEENLSHFLIYTSTEIRTTYGNGIKILPIFPTIGISKF